MSLLIRGMFSNPPAYGSQIVSRVLNTPALKAEWMECIKTMSSRIIRMRAALYAALTELKTPGTWEHIIEQIGMFSYTGMNGESICTGMGGLVILLSLTTASHLWSRLVLAELQSTKLVNDYHIYLLKSGRISMCGLNERNVKYVAQAMNDVITKYPAEAGPQVVLM